MGKIKIKRYIYIEWIWFFFGCVKKSTCCVQLGTSYYYILVGFGTEPAGSNGVSPVQLFSLLSWYNGGGQNKLRRV